MSNDARLQLEQHLSDLYHLLTRFEGLQQQKDAAYQRHAHLYTPYKNQWRAGMYWLWVLILTVALTLLAFVAAVGITVGVGATAASIPVDATTTISEQQMAATMGPALGAMALFLLPLPLALIAAGVIVGVRNARMPAKNAQLEQINQQTALRIGELTAPEIAPIEQQLSLARHDYSAAFAGWFPETYLSSVDVGACWQIVHDHRASTVQDAVNRLLTDRHEQYLRDAAAAQIAEQQRATRVAQMNGIINATLQGAMIGAIHSESAATRAAMAAPRTIRIERR